MKEEIKIPYGRADFKELRDEGYQYVDKTRYIEQIESVSYPILLRPRRFGKSLFASTLFYYYDINSKPLFDRLFKNTYIHANKTSKANSYHVLRFNFSGLNTDSVKELRASFLDATHLAIKHFINYYELGIDLGQANDEIILLDRFLTALKNHPLIDKNVYIIIDEYDHFANSMLRDQETFLSLVGSDGFVRAWYEKLKIHAGEGCIGQLFITGVSPITLDSLSSGFNIARNISRELYMNESLGFTADEVMGLMGAVGVPQEETMKTLQANYNGYLFSARANTKIFNSNMVLYYLDSYQKTGYPPEQILDPNIISDYSRIEDSFNLYANKEKRIEIINKLLESKGEKVAISPIFNLKLGFSRNDLLSLLYYQGYLTISEGRGLEVILQVPNKVIKDVYFDYYRHYLSKMLGYNHADNVRDIVESLINDNDIEPLIENMEQVIDTLSPRDNRWFNEFSIKTILLTYFKAILDYEVISEYPIRQGYADLTFFPIFDKETSNHFIFELKYVDYPRNKQGKITSHVAREEDIKVANLDAIQKLKKYLESSKFEGINHLYHYVFIVANNKVQQEYLIPEL